MLVGRIRNLKSFKSLFKDGAMHEYGIRLHEYVMRNFRANILWVFTGGVQTLNDISQYSDHWCEADNLANVVNPMV